MFSGYLGTAVYRCLCGREQSAKHDQCYGGVDERAAIACGWVRGVRLGWACPVCSGNEARWMKASHG